MSEQSHADALMIRELLMLVVKYALLDADDLTADLAEQARQAQAELLAVHGGAMPPDVQLDSQWTHAVDEAETDRALNQHSGVSLTLPPVLPFDAGLLLASPLDLDQLRTRIRGATATG